MISWSGKCRAWKPTGVQRRENQRSCGEKLLGYWFYIWIRAIRIFWPANNLSLITAGMSQMSPIEFHMLTDTHGFALGPHVARSSDCGVTSKCTAIGRCFFLVWPTIGLSKIELYTPYKTGQFDNASTATTTVDMASGRVGWQDSTTVRN